MHELACVLVVLCMQQDFKVTERVQFAPTVVPGAGFVVTDRVTTKPKPMASAVPDPNADGAYIVMFTASWCGPCNSFKNNTASKWKAAGVSITYVDVDAQPQWKQPNYPTFWAVSRRTAKPIKKWIGTPPLSSVLEVTQPKPATEATPAAPPENPADGAIKSPPAVYGSTSSLRDWIHSRYTPQTQLWADVQPRSRVWTHLTNEHGFPPDAVRGLTQWEAMALHDSAHRGIRPPGF